MLLKTCLIFSSLGVTAIIPYTILKAQKVSEPQDIYSFSLDDSFGAVLDSGGNQNPKRLTLKDYFETNCKRVNSTMIVCQAQESLPWPEFYYVEKLGDKNTYHKIKSFTFEIANSHPILELELDNGERKRMTNFATNWRIESFSKDTIVPEVDCITCNTSSGGAITQ